MNGEEMVLMAASGFVAIMAESVEFFLPEHREPVDEFLIQRNEKGRFATDVS